MEPPIDLFMHRMYNPPRSIPRIISNTYLEDYGDYRVILVGVGVNIIREGDCLRFQTCVRVIWQNSLILQNCNKKWENLI